MTCYILRMATSKEHPEALLRLSPADASQRVRKAWAEELIRRIEANEPGIPAEQVYAEIDTDLQANETERRKGRA